MTAHTLATRETGIELISSDDSISTSRGRKSMYGGGGSSVLMTPEQIETLEKSVQGLVAKAMCPWLALGRND